MNTKATALETLFEKAEDYSKTSVELLKLKAIDISANVVSSLVIKLVLFVVAVMLIFIVTVGLALGIGALLGKSYYGFFIISGCYLIIFLLMYAFRNTIIKQPIQNNIIDQLQS